jgi:hypothetical protein
MYYNNSSFPIALYKFNKGIMEEGYNIDNILFILNQKNFEEDFFKAINSKEKQDLFGYLTTTLPPIIFSNIKSFKFTDFKLLSINDISEIRRIASIRIDIKAIDEKLKEIENDSILLAIKKDKIITELILFTFQFVFIELSKNIVATKIGDINYFFDIKNNSKKFDNFIDKTSRNTPDRIEAQKKFINGYITSFETLDMEEIKTLERELIFMLDQTNQKKRLNNIFETNIVFRENISRTQKNNIFKYFFKNVTAKFFYPFLNDNSIDDYEVSINFLTFIKRARK